MFVLSTHFSLFFCWVSGGGSSRMKAADDPVWLLCLHRVNGDLSVAGAGSRMVDLCCWNEGVPYSIFSFLLLGIWGLFVLNEGGGWSCLAAMPAPS